MHMQGTASKTFALLIGLAIAPLAAHAQNYEVRHDRKLEKMILERTAGRVGAIRGGLQDEWRKPTAMDRIIAMTARDVSLRQMTPVVHEQPVMIAETSFVRPRDLAQEISAQALPMPARVVEVPDRTQVVAINMPPIRGALVMASADLDG